MTLKDALTAEADPHLSKMLNMLTPSAKKLKEDEIRKILKGTSKKSYKIKDLHSIRMLCSYRVKKRLSLFPFKKKKLTGDTFPPSY